eukprot:2959521-Rhodomonas_salina.1
MTGRTIISLNTGQTHERARVSDLSRSGIPRLPPLIGPKALCCYHDRTYKPSVPNGSTPRTSTTSTGYTDESNRDI